MASIGDVAKLAGVSRSTVSLVCNNKGYVSDETRKKIEKAMKELNYIPSELGRNLKMQKSGITGCEKSPDSRSTYLCGSTCIGDPAAGSTDPDFQTE